MNTKQSYIVKPDPVNDFSLAVFSDRVHVEYVLLREGYEYTVMVHSTESYNCIYTITPKFGMGISKGADALIRAVLGKDWKRNGYTYYRQTKKRSK